MISLGTFNFQINQYYKLLCIKRNIDWGFLNSKLVFIFKLNFYIILSCEVEAIQKSVFFLCFFDTNYV